MDKKKELISLMQELFAAPAHLWPAKVTAVNKDALTCDVEPIGKPELFDVRLKAGVDQVTDGLVEIPVVGSMVMITPIGKSKTEAVVVVQSQVEEVLIFGGQNGGLIKVSKLIEELNKTNAMVNAIAESLKDFVPVPADGGAALKQFSALKLTGKSTGNFSEIENTKVKH